MAQLPVDLRPLCRCNNCMGIFIDTNPKPGQDEFNVANCNIPELDHIVCPICETDGYLTEVLTA